MRDIIRHLPRPSDILIAMSLLTRIPVPIDHNQAGARMRDAIWAYPIIGALIGAIGGAILNILAPTALPAGFGAAIALGVMIALTGAMHEDGLADSFDGLWGGHDPEQRLNIMRDSRIGVYGLLALIVVLFAQWSALAALSAQNAIWPLMAVGAASRLPMVLGMYFLPLARNNGLSAKVGTAYGVSVIWAIIWCVILVLLALGPYGIGVMGFAVLAALPIAWAARAKIGGQTGDILGAIAKCAELGALAGLFLI